jgi:capsular polysaccharide export protein
LKHRGRHYLFLQGLASPFFGRLALYLRKQGAEVSRINFCPGDGLYWPLPKAVAFRRKREEFDDFFYRLLLEGRFTDLILFGDARTFHEQAIARARQQGLRVHVFEEGYIRPDWITVERNGVNGHSGLPKDPAWYLEAGNHLPPLPQVHHAPTPLWRRATQDAAFHLANLSAPLRYPHYRTHRPRSPLSEYAGWAKRFSAFPLRRALEEGQLRALLGGSHPLFFLPLQLSGDSQLVKHSPFDNVASVIRQVVRSFAAAALPEAELLIKNHPLDTGHEHHARTALQASVEFGVEKRVHFFESGNLPLIFKRVQGTVVVNSTVGLVALTYDCPVCALADAIYRMPGLVHQGSLEEFWRQPQKPDHQLARAFREVVVATTQVNGNFFTRQGIRLAVQGCERMLGDESPLETLKKQVNGQRKQIDVVQT